MSSGRDMMVGEWPNQGQRDVEVFFGGTKFQKLFEAIAKLCGTVRCLCGAGLILVLTFSIRKKGGLNPA